MKKLISAVRRYLFLRRINPQERYLFGLLDQVITRTQWTDGIKTVLNAPTVPKFRLMLLQLAQAQFDDRKAMLDVVGHEVASILPHYRVKSFELPGSQLNRGEDVYYLRLDLCNLARDQHFAIDLEESVVYKVIKATQDGVFYTRALNPEHPPRFYPRRSGYLPVFLVHHYHANETQNV